MSAPHAARRSLPIVGAVLVALLIVASVRRLAERSADAAGRRLRALLALGTTLRAHAWRPDEEPAAPQEEVHGEEVRAPPPTRAPGAGGVSGSATRAPQRRGVTAPGPEPSSLRLAPARVLELVARRQLPSSRSVPARAGLPAGQRLGGVTALGIGLEDGDVLESVDGVPAWSREEAISAVIAARGRGATRIMARLRRGRRKIVLVAELPSDDELSRILSEGDAASGSP